MSSSSGSNQAGVSPLEVVQGFYAALGDGNVPGVLGLLDDQVRWTEAERFPYYSGTWVGPRAVLENLLKRLAQDWDLFSATASRASTSCC
jgi:ketosteroid isomerase-like protein